MPSKSTGRKLIRKSRRLGRKPPEQSSQEFLGNLQAYLENVGPILDGVEKQTPYGLAHTYRNVWKLQRLVGLEPPVVALKEVRKAEKEWRETGDRLLRIQREKAW